MDRNKLSQVKYLYKEIEILQRQINNLDYDITTDVVKGSDPEFPYINRSVKITGVNIKGYEEELKKLKSRLSKRVSELLKLLDEINDYIESIDDSLIRQVIILKYIEGLTWNQVAAKIGGGTTADSLRMMLNRYLKNS